MEKVNAVIFLDGKKPATPIEEYFFRCLRALVLDNIIKLQESPHVDKIFVCTSDKSFGNVLNRLKQLNNKKKLNKKVAAVEVDTDCLCPTDKFSFGKSLAKLIKKHSLDKLFYLGAGAGILLETEEVNQIAKKIAESSNLIIANNFYSSDFLAFAPAKAIFKIKDLPEEDNPMAYLLKDKGGLKSQKIIASAGTFLDIDSVIDLAILEKYSKKGPFISKELAKEKQLDLKLKKLFTVFEDHNAEIFLAGRVGSHIYAQISQNLKCRFRIFSEECGMKAWGREKSGKVYSYLGKLMEEVGLEGFFKILEKTSSAAFIDSRVLFSHFGEKVSRADRFYSDSGQFERIENNFARKLTHLSTKSAIPVFLGGHSLLSGGLYVLTEIFLEKKNGVAKMQLL